MTCVEVREMLSDLIDVRNGEMPLPGMTCLAETGVRENAEAHLATCAECRGEMIILEEVGRVYADFNVGEMPAQHFSNYGSLVRQRIAASNKVIKMPVRYFSVKRFAASLATAACLAVIVMQVIPHKTKPSLKPAPVAFTNIPKSNSSKTPFRIATPSANSDLMTVGNRINATNLEYNADDPLPVINELNKEEGKFGYIYFIEDFKVGEQPLLGLALRTTRDKDIDRSKDTLGLEVYDILPGSVAHKMGLLRGDLIVSVNGMNIESGSSESAAKFFDAIKRLGTDAKVSMDFVRRDREGLVYYQRNCVLGQPGTTFE